LTLHEPTLFVSLFGFTLLSTLLLVTAAANRDALREQRLWAWGNVASCAGLLIGGMETAPLLVHAVLSYGLIGLGLALVLKGVRVFARAELGPAWVLLITALALLLPGWYALVQPDLEQRLVVTGLYFGLLNLLAAQQLWRLRHREMVLVAVAGFAVLGLVLLLRALLLAWQPPGVEALRAQVVPLSLLAITLAQVTVAFGFILMVARRFALNLRQLSELDALTGTLNRQGLMSQGLRLLRRARQAQRPVALMMIDADHFKRINDEHGHPAGDLVIRHLAEQLRSRLRASDALVRYGGEEFLLMLDGVNARAALPIAERLREQIERVAASDPELPCAYTVSMGVAGAEDHGHALQPALAAADEALYRAKAAGRNCVSA